jgi:hypothetical protein
MNTDFRISIDFWQHPKTKKLIRRAGLEGVRSLQILWSWAAVNRSNGSLSGMDGEDIELAADWTGDIGMLIKALEELHWIDKTDEGYVLHDWQEHNPWAADAEARGDKARLSRLRQVNPAAYEKCVAAGKTAISQREYEELKNNFCERQRFAGESPENASVAPAPSPSLKLQALNINTPLSPNGDIPPQGESGKGKKQSKKPDETIQSVLAEQPTELVPSLLEFVEHRKHIKKPLSAHALRLNIAALQKLAPDDIDRQKYLAEYAIMKGWQGFYLPDEEKQAADKIPKPTTYAQQVKYEQDQQARALLAASQRRREANATQLSGNGGTGGKTQLALPPWWGPD